MPGGVPVSRLRAARLPFKRAAGEENFGPEGPFQAKMPPKALVRRFHKSRDSAFACAHSALVGCSACGLLLPPLPRPCCWHASGHAAMRLHARRPPGCSNELAPCHRCVIMTRSPSLRGASCTSVQDAAAERRLMVATSGSYRRLGRTVPIDLKAIRA